MSNAAEKSYKIITEIINYILWLILFEEQLGWFGGMKAWSGKIKAKYEKK